MASSLSPCEPGRKVAPVVAARQHDHHGGRERGHDNKRRSSLNDKERYPDEEDEEALAVMGESPLRRLSFVKEGPSQEELKRIVMQMLPQVPR